MIDSAAMSIADFVSAAERDAAVLTRSKALYWRDYKRRHGEAAGIRLADELRSQVRAMRPDWPSPRERAEDHAAHLRVLDALEHVASCRR
jgi:hypothetical protein